MPDDSRYEAALRTAIAILDELTMRPDMSRPKKLSTITFIVLHAMRQGEGSQPGRHGTEPSIN
jgi:hypothetical protein